MSDTNRQTLDYFTVVGVGRSGTSLLMTMLDSHPGLSMPPETQFVTRHLQRRPCANLDEARRGLTNEANFARLGFDADDFFRPYDTGVATYSNSSAYRRILTLWAERTGLTRVGDKSPKNVECLPIIHRLFPHGHVIHIVRDPRDVFLSRTKAGWCSGRSAWLQTLAYRAQFDMGRETGQRLFGDRYLEVRYEELVASPQKALNRICDLLGVPFDDRMLARDDSAGSHVFPEEMDWKREVLGPLLATNTEKWRRELPDRLIAFIEDCCVTSFDDQGYQPANGRAPGAGGLSGGATQAGMSALSHAYRQRLAVLNRRAIQAIDRSAPARLAA